MSEENGNDTHPSSFISDGRTGRRPSCEPFESVPPVDCSDSGLLCRSWAGVCLYAENCWAICAEYDSSEDCAGFAGKELTPVAGFVSSG